MRTPWGTRRRPKLRRRRVAAAACALTLAAAGTAYATHLIGDNPLGHTTLDQVLTGGNPDTGFQNLTLEDITDQQHIVRDAGLEGTAKIPAAPAGREDVRHSLAYVSQFTDFQLADEESPSRVEFLDPDPSGTASAAYRPEETFVPFEVDATIRQVNQFVPESPIAQGDDLGNVGNAMDFALMTGDNADSMQRNETTWVRELIEGGTTINFNSGRTDAGYYASPQFLSKPSCVAYLAAEAGNVGNITAEAALYTGVQDYSDYGNNPLVEPNYYDPNSPEHQYADWPNYDGLMDRAAQLSITPVGLDNPATGAPGDVPTYITNGNHDALVQGNEDATAAYEDIALGCAKPLAAAGTTDPADGLQNLVDILGDPLNSVIMNVPPDPARRYVDRPQIKEIFSAEDDGHGFGFVDAAQETASNDAASYYAWDPPETPGFRFISIDTNSEGGIVGVSSAGNIDQPQWQWLENELEAAQEDDKLIVIFGHHPVRSLDADAPDEVATACTTDIPHGDTPEHDINPGCDLDPRNSLPLHLGNAESTSGGESFVSLIDRNPNVIAYVAGHTHSHNLDLFQRSSEDSGWWSIETSAVVDWPTQSRLIEVMDNRDDTLSIFGTLIDHASNGTAPADGTDACGVTPSCSDGDGFDHHELGSIGRTLAYNDPQGGDGSGEGAPNDQNAELLLFDPREADLSITKTDSPDPVEAGQTLTYTLTVSNTDDPSDVSGAPGVVVTDDLPTTADFVSATPSGGGACPTPAPGADLVCTFPDIDSGDSETVTVEVTPQTAGQIVNRASVKSIFNDPTPGNDTVEQTTTVNPAAGPDEADLAITKTGSPASLTVGQQLTYTLSVKNNGPDSATGVAVTDTLPSGTIFVSATAPGGCELDLSTVTCLLGTLADEATATAQLVVTPQLAGTLTNQATTSSGVSDPIAANNTDGESTQVQPLPAGSAPSGSCRGQTATIVGTASGETIVGTPSRDVIVAGEGNDVVLARGAGDLVCAGGGNDRAFGGKGRDLLLGQAGNDRLGGGKGRDRALGGPGRDRCTSSRFRNCQTRRRR